MNPEIEALPEPVREDLFARETADRLVHQLASGPLPTRTRSDTARRLFERDRGAGRARKGRELFIERGFTKPLVGWFDTLHASELGATSDHEFGPLVGTGSVIFESVLVSLVTAPALASGAFLGALIGHLKNNRRHQRGGSWTEQDELEVWAGQKPKGGRKGPTMITHAAVALALGCGLQAADPQVRAFVERRFPRAYHDRVRDLTFSKHIEHVRWKYRNETAHMPTVSYDMIAYQTFTQLIVAADSFTAWDLHKAKSEPPSDGDGVLNPLVHPPAVP